MIHPVMPVYFKLASRKLKLTAGPDRFYLLFTGTEDLTLF
jgi:hypothetical protein